MDWFGSGDKGGGSIFGNGGAVGNILGGLGTAATIYGMYQTNKNNQDQLAQNDKFKQQEFAEGVRQFDIKQALAQAQLGAGGGGGGGGAGAAIAAQVQAAHSRAMQGAYDTLIGAVETGRAGEAASLTGMLDRIQKAYAQR